MGALFMALLTSKLVSYSAGRPKPHSAASKPMRLLNSLSVELAVLAKGGQL